MMTPHGIRRNSWLELLEIVMALALVYGAYYLGAPTYELLIVGGVAAALVEFNRLNRRLDAFTEYVIDELEECRKRRSATIDDDDD